MILREQGRVTGLTTAATIWATASVGLSIGFGMYVLAALTTLIMFALLRMHDVPLWRRVVKKQSQSHPHSLPEQSVIPGPPRAEDRREGPNGAERREGDPGDDR